MDPSTIAFTSIIDIAAVGIVPQSFASFVAGHPTTASAAIDFNHNSTTTPFAPTSSSAADLPPVAVNFVQVAAPVVASGFLQLAIALPLIVSFDSLPIAGFALAAAVIALGFRSVANPFAAELQVMALHSVILAAAAPQVVALIFQLEFLVEHLLVALALVQLVDLVLDPYLIKLKFECFL